SALIIFLGAMWLRMFNGGAGAAHRAAAMRILSDSGSDMTDAAGHKIRNAESGHDLHKWLEADIPLVVSRNLFSVNLDYYPVDGTRPSQPSRTGSRETFWDELAKSLSTQADQQEKRANLIQNLRQQA